MGFATGFAAGLVEGKKKWSWGDNSNNYKPNCINDPDWEIFKSLPEPEPNQVIWGVRIIDPSYKKAGSYYDWIPNLNIHGTYEPDTSSETKCHIYVEYIVATIINPDVSGDPPMANVYRPSYHIDWGDGTSSSHKGGNASYTYPYYAGAGGWDGGAATTLKHVYSDKGLYIVTVTVEKPVFESPNDEASMTMNLVVWIHSSSGMMRGANTLKYVNSGEYDNFEILNTALFMDNYSLEKIDGVDFSKVINVENYTFQACQTIEEIDLPNCTFIGNDAFNGCASLKKINAPKCREIGSNCFSGCYALKEISLPSCTSVGSAPFPSGEQSQLEKISLPLIKSISWTMKKNRRLLEINCPNAESVVDGAFQNCMALHTVTFAENCTFGQSCFYNCHSLYPRPDGSIN